MADKKAFKHTKSFAWQICKDENERDRVDIKQQAVLDGFRFGDRVLSKLKKWVAGEEEHPTQPIGVEAIKKWIKAYNKIKNNQEKFKVKIGFAGQTGAGKTSLLNAILGIEELLPSSSSQASTAVACEVSWNHEGTKQELRAEVTFRSLESITKELNEFFAMMEQRKELLEQEENATGDTWDLQEEIREMGANMKDTLGKISSLWGFDEKQLDDMTTLDLLNANKRVNELLGTTIVIKETDPQSFSDKVKPYLDSTAGDHGGNGDEFAAWPLLEGVKIYLQDDDRFLRYGIVLVDLPGLSDFTGGRSQVAERSFKDLAVTVIVMPVIRAADESTGNRLMSENQEIRMQMNDKFHNKAFCVVLSKADDINTEPFLRHSQAAKENLSLGNQLQRIEGLQQGLKGDEKQFKVAKKSAGKLLAKLRRLRERLFKAEKAVKRSDKTIQNIRGQKKAVTRKYKETKDSLQDLRQKIETSRAASAFLRNNRQMVAISLRNKFVQARIRKDFQRRQRRVVVKDKKCLYDGTVEIFPVSTVGYWTSCVANLEPIIGFPTLNHSGIPKLKQWLHEATFQTREDQLDRTLSGLSRLFSSMHGWARKQDEALNREDAEAFKKEMLEGIHAKYIKELENILNQSSRNITKIKPMKNKTEALKASKTQCNGIVNKWSRRYPEDPTSYVLMYWATQNAIIRYGGLPHKTTGILLREYTWLDDLARPMFQVIVPDWNQAIHRDLPECEGIICKDIENGWNQYIDDIQAYITDRAPVLGSRWDEIKPTLQEVKSETRLKVREILTKTKEGAANVHGVVGTKIYCEMRPGFEAALEIRGKGSLRRRHGHLVDFANKRCDQMFESACDKLEQDVCVHLQKASKQLQDLAKFCVEAVENQISMLLEPLINNPTPEAHSSKRGIQREIMPALNKWRDTWRMPPSSKQDHVMRGDFEIPDPEVIAVEENITLSTELDGTDSEECGTTDSDDFEDEDEDVDEDDHASENDIQVVSGLEVKMEVDEEPQEKARTSNSFVEPQAKQEINRPQRTTRSSVKKMTTTE